MSNMRLAHINAADLAALSGYPSFLPSLPAANLQNSMRCRVARSTSLADQQIKGTWSGSYQAISYVLLWRHNLSDAGQWRIELFNAANWTDRIYDSGFVDYDPTALGDLSWGLTPLGATLWYDKFAKFRQAVFWLPTTYVAQSFRITLRDPSNADGYVEASRLWMGKYWTPKNNFSWDHTISWVDSSVSTRSAGGSIRVFHKARNRELTIPFGQLEAADRAEFLDILRNRGSSEEVFATLFPDQADKIERDYMIVGLIKPGHALTRSNPVFWADKITIEET